MKAAVLRAHGPIGNIVLEDDYPTPRPGPGWVLIRVRACSINHHDIFTRRGMPGIKIPLPLVVGSDVAGEVAELGEAVEAWQVGDRVLIDPVPSPETNNRFIGETMDGGRAEYCLAHAAKLLAIPPGVSFETAAAIPLAYATARRMVCTIGRLQRGETIAVLGASGGVGTAVVLLAKLAGARVIACAGSEAKMARLREIGADHVVNYRAGGFRQAIWDLVGKPRYSGEGGVDVLVNSTGGDTWVDSVRCLKRGGRLLTCGATAGFEERVDVRYIWTFEQQILGSNAWTREDIAALLGHAADGSLVPIVDMVLPLARIHEAEAAVEGREVFGKVVVTP